MYLLTAFGVTVGFHRMLTHRSFRTSKPVEYVFAALGSMAVQGPVINWVADHRKHHAHTDEEGDPHSPHVGQGNGAGGARLRGLLHAHVGWLVTDARAARRATATPRTSWRTAACSRSTRGSPRWCSPGSRVPFALGCADHRRARGRADRTAVGRPRAHLPAAPRDLVDQLDLPLLRSPPLRRSTTTRRTCSGSRCRASARRGTTTTTRSRARRSTACGRFELDPSGWLIARPGALGLAWDVVRITPERQRARLSDARAG